MDGQGRQLTFLIPMALPRVLTSAPPKRLSAARRSTLSGDSAASALTAHTQSAALPYRCTLTGDDKLVHGEGLSSKPCRSFALPPTSEKTWSTATATFFSSQRKLSAKAAGFSGTVLADAEASCGARYMPHSALSQPSR